MINGPVHLYAKVSVYRSAGFQLDIYSNFSYKIKKTTYIYVAIANYFRTFTNFRVLNCEIPLFVTLNVGIYSPAS